MSTQNSNEVWYSKNHGRTEIHDGTAQNISIEKLKSFRFARQRNLVSKQNDIPKYAPYVSPSKSNDCDAVLTSQNSVSHVLAVGPLKKHVEKKKRDADAAFDGGISKSWKRIRALSSDSESEESSSRSDQLGNCFTSNDRSQTGYTVLGINDLNESSVEPEGLDKGKTFLDAFKEYSMNGSPHKHGVGVLGRYTLSSDQRTLCYRFQKQFPQASTEGCFEALKEANWNLDEAIANRLATHDPERDSVVSAKKEMIERETVNENVIDVPSDNDESDDDNSSCSNIESQLSIQREAAVSGARVKKRHRLSPKELGERTVEFFNYATLEELINAPKMNKKLANLIMPLRGFKSFKDLCRKLDEARGLNSELAEAYKDFLALRDRLDGLLEMCGSISERIQQAVSEIITGEKQPEPQPSLLSSALTLKPYQVVGLNWLCLLHDNEQNAILADEMGLGKTIQVISFLAYLRQKNVPGPHLIVVPSSTIDNWMLEFQRWCPVLVVEPYYGDMEARRTFRFEFRKGTEQPDVILTTYNMVGSQAQDRGFFQNSAFNYAVYDEAHMLKNCLTNRYRNLLRIPSERRILLTGTPLQNSLTELMSLMYFLMPEFFAEHLRTQSELKTLFMMFGQKKDGRIAEYEHEKIMQAGQIMRPFVLRRLKAEVLNDLPAKIEQVDRCEMTKKQRALYNKMFADATAALNKSGVSALKGKKGMGLFMDLRKAANHPLLLRSLYDDTKLRKMAKAMLKEPTHSDANEQYVWEDMCVMSDFELHKLCQEYDSIADQALEPKDILNSSKFERLDVLLPKIKEQRCKALIFSQFTIVLDVLETYLQIRQHSYLRLDGSTPVVERHGLIETFNSDESIFLFIVSTRAGGLGVNLTAANYIILHDIDYNPYNDKQAEDRCHRLGQTRDVTVVRLICADSVEEHMLKLAQQKLQLEKRVTSAKEEEFDVEKMLKDALKISSE